MTPDLHVYRHVYLHTHVHVPRKHTRTERKRHTHTHKEKQETVKMSIGEWKNRLILWNIVIKRNDFLITRNWLNLGNMLKGTLHKITHFMLSCIRSPNTGKASPCWKTHKTVWNGSREWMGNGWGSFSTGGTVLIRLWVTQMFFIQTLW